MKFFNIDKNKIKLLHLSQVENFKNNNYLEINSYLNQLFKREIKIPLNIILFWHDELMPPHIKKSYQSIINNNPEFKIHLFNIESARDFIKENYDQNVLNTYDKFKPIAFKCDLFRYCALYKLGGIYLDIKINIVNNFKLINLAGYEELYTIEKYENDFLMTPGFIITKERNPRIEKIINNIVLNVENKFYGNHPTSPTSARRFFSINDMHLFKFIYFYDNIYIQYKFNPVFKILEIPELYRNEQNKDLSTYWKNMWMNKNIYN